MCDAVCNVTCYVICHLQRVCLFDVFFSRFQFLVSVLNWTSGCCFKMGSSTRVSCLSHGSRPVPFLEEMFPSLLATVYFRYLKAVLLESCSSFRGPRCLEIFLKSGFYVHCDPIFPRQLEIFAKNVCYVSDVHACVFVCLVLILLWSLVLD